MPVLGYLWVISVWLQVELGLTCFLLVHGSAFIVLTVLYCVVVGVKVAGELIWTYLEDVAIVVMAN